ncbi:hypothetical protein EXE25_00480 [Acinetobacter bouvetii]|uniref:Uncharacterized protein n=1 Tax=Acinetobacter bouvetii TaxID=202951 RepID=A0A4Q7B3M4_9GAMM|nr:hypothetical protein EXE25_00480 [Acinetobacter bouvetii]TCB74842.1 hypothetical protein E0H91_07595 [Acinetobacter sp. ANC 4177]
MNFFENQHALASWFFYTGVIFEQKNQLRIGQMNREYCYVFCVLVIDMEVFFIKLTSLCKTWKKYLT